MVHNRMNTQTPGLERRVVFSALASFAGIVLGRFFYTVAQRALPSLPEGTYIVPVIAIAAAILAAIVVPGAARFLPERLDGTLRTHPWRAMGFGVITVLAVIQIARLTEHAAAAPSPITILTDNEFWTQHECGSAYFHAVELSEAGDANIYRADHYPVLNRNLTPHSSIEGLRIEDAYQYPPPFLLLPKALLEISRNFPTVRLIWFVLQIGAVFAAMLALTRFVGGRHGLGMGLLVPLVITAPAALYAYQYTQFHLLAVAMAVGGMTAFEYRRNALGGALLAFAVLGKIFPGFLLVFLAAEKRWKPLLWTIGFASAFSLAALGIFGSAPFSAFLHYQLPRLFSFDAFAFLDVWPEVRFELLTANLSPQGQIMKLAELGVPGMSRTVGTVVNTMCVVLLFAMILRAAKRPAGNLQRARTWLAVICAASLLSPAAWGDYVPWPALWLLSTFAAETQKSRLQIMFLSACGIFLYFLIGLVPLGTFPSQNITYALSTLCFLLMVSLTVSALIRQRSEVGHEARFKSRNEDTEWMNASPVESNS